MSFPILLDACSGVQVTHPMGIACYFFTSKSMGNV